MDKINQRTFGRIALSLLILMGAAGCTETTDLVEVAGKVTIDGEPIMKGSISFVSADGSTPTGGGIIQDGSYTARVPPGEKVVLVLGNKLVGQEPEYEDMPDSPMRDKYEMITPEAYNAKHLSPLRANITGSQQDLNFELTKNVSSE